MAADALRAPLTANVNRYPQSFVSDPMILVHGVLPVSTAHRGDVRCDGGSHGGASAEGRRPAGVDDGVQAGDGPADRRGREDGGRAQSRARHRAQRDPQLEAVCRGGRDDGGAGQGGRGAGPSAARGGRQDPRTRASGGTPNYGGRDPAWRPGGRKKKNVGAPRGPAGDPAAMTA